MPSLGPLKHNNHLLRPRLLFYEGFEPKLSYTVENPLICGHSWAHVKWPPNGGWLLNRGSS